MTRLAKLLRVALLKRNFVQPSVRTIHITSRFMRIFSWTFTYFFAKLGFQPNLVSLASIIFGILGALFASRSEFTLFSICCFVWAFLDCCDGELARFYERKGQQSQIGGVFLESTNSNLQYIIWLPSIGIGLLNLNIISNSSVLVSILACAGFASARSIFKSNVSENRIADRWILRFFISQCPTGGDIRQSNRFFRYFYFCWRNLLTQFGVMLFLYLYASFDKDNSTMEIIFWTYTILYSCFSFIVILSVVFLSSRLKNLRY